ncbi:WWE domain protein (macronuclear) [Tetrahymena thermophila SB210]|uniref:WWE domain protein n=1 Tax=Tetrahymena thermophila (strain SB210) TaxID=312017 RepID=Q23Q07_TETTS|nr:WWE domain protein [Tetrahymena thermophila SB210]EAR98528.1 WWE domain protein [Tetrahymena thermophila SB210]|eukprot:XP_001018773.1 WWE domain protein [Tetrahymena thermophila SB210]
MNTIEENPFQEDQLVGFNSKDITMELMCGICFEISVQASECVQCGQIFCEICINDYKKKNKISKCPTCCNDGWSLKKPHKVYQKILSRLQFKCQSPGCLSPYTIDNFKSHEHLYPNENQIMYEFILLSEQGVKSELDQSLIKYLEKKYQNNEKIFNHYVQNQRYTFDFSNHNSLKATKCQNNEQCTIIRKQHSKPQTLIKYRWIWYNNDQQKWELYNPEQNQILNQYYETFIQNPDSNQKFYLKIFDFDYEFDFKQLHQIRISTNFRRSIFRSQVFNRQRFIQS